jgi:hypothetical protein
MRAGYTEDVPILQVMVEDAERYADFLIERIRDIERGIFTATEVLEDLRREGDLG